MQKINFILSVTEYCNFNCDYCIEKVQNLKNRFNDFDIKETIVELENVIKKHSDKKILVSFFGGEPTLKKDKIITFLDILKTKKYFHDLEFEITTNGYIYFKELLDFIKENNSSLRVTLSYDSKGQSKRVKNLDTIKVVEENVLKYSEYYIKNNFNRCLITNNCCVTEDNVDKVYDSFCDIFFNKKINSITFSTVFTEYWKKESFVKLYKEYKKIYDFIVDTNIKNNRIIYILPSISGNHKDAWKKYNPLFYQEKNDKDILKEIHVSDNQSVEVYERRYLNKKTYKLKPLNIDKNIEKIKDIELLTLRISSSNYNYFDKLTMQLLLGDNINRYKKEIYCLFNFNIFLCNKYKKAIKRLLKNKINFFYFLNQYKYTDLFLSIYGLDKLKEINLLLNKNINFSILKNKIIVNGLYFNFININDKISIRFSNNNFFINKEYIHDTKKNIQKCIIREICRCILVSSFEKLNLNIKNEIIDLICNNFYIYIYNTRR